MASYGRLARTGSTLTMSSKKQRNKSLTITIPEAELDTIQNVTLSEKTNQRETGGVLLGGRIADDEIFCMTATRPGPNAEQYKAEFAPDIEYAQDIVDDLRNEFDVVWIGTWHKHPGAMNELSRGDIEQMREFVQDPELLDEIIAVITTIDKDTVKINPFYMDKEMSPKRTNLEVIGRQETEEKMKELRMSNGEAGDIVTDVNFDRETPDDLRRLSKKKLVRYVVPDQYEKKVRKYIHRFK